MCSYYRRFIPNFSPVATALIRLTTKFAKFDWNKEWQAEFLKDSLTMVPFIAYLILANHICYIQMLAMIAPGVCLCHKQDTQGEMKPNEKPIHYLTLKLTASQTNWPTIEKEAFPIFYALQKPRSVFA